MSEQGEGMHPKGKGIVPNLRRIVGLGVSKPQESPLEKIERDLNSLLTTILCDRIK